MNQTLDRSIAPQAKPVSDPQMILPLSVQLANGILVHFLSAGTQEVVRLELLFRTGAVSHELPVVPGMAVSMLKGGTASHNATQIAEWVDNYGAFLETEPGKDYSSVTLYSLNRFLPQVLPVVRQIINESSYPEDEFDISKSNKTQKFLVGLEKVGFVAGKRFQELLFGEKGYGTPVNTDQYENLNRAEVIEFYRNNIQFQPFELFVSGFISDTVKQLILDEFGRFETRGSAILHSPGNAPMIGGKHFIEKENAMQSAIRIGRPLFTRNHPDYFGMKVLLTILGGYFGSRLMSNIREDKGYTYGIGAGLAVMKHAGYFYISTEVGADVCSAALDEIYKEINVLHHEAVPAAELDLVKNYMLGSLIKSFEGPFEYMERFKTIHLDGFGEDYYKRYASTIRNIQADELMALASKWLRPEDFTQLVVGKM
ncbi:MAG: pitrilysin family protein [Bacteroidia bacterium]